MDVRKLLRNPRFRLAQSPAPEAQGIKQLLDRAPPNLPRTYVRFLNACNGARGKVPYETGYLEIFSLERVALENHTPVLDGFFAFGSDGADELFVFDLRKPDGAPVCTVNAKEAAPERVVPLTNSFSEFLEGIVVQGGSA